MIGASLLFAVMAVATREASAQMSAGQLVLIRFVVMGVGTMALWSVGYGTIRPRNLRLLGLRGVLGGGAVLLYFVSLGMARDAGTASLLQYTSPIFTNLFGWAALGERPSGRLAAGGFIALGGVTMVLRTPGGLALGWGEVAAFASAIIAGGAVVTIRAARAYDDATTILLASSVGGALLALPFALADWQVAGLQVWTLALVVGVSSFFAQWMMTHAFGLVRAGEGALYQLLTPIFTFGLGAALLGEPISFWAAAGALLTVAALGYAALPARPRQLHPDGEQT
jgi:drug/metabolite transporter (DMT)-like permease